MGNHVAVPAVGGVRPPPPPPAKLTSDQYLALFIRDVACSVLSLAAGIIILYQMCKPPGRNPLERQLFKFIIHLVSRHHPQRSSLTAFITTELSKAQHDHAVNSNAISG